jgi:hypothetical protein
MNQFVQKYQSVVKGVLSGFDRLVFQGTLMPLCTPGGMASYLQSALVLLKEFAGHVEKMTHWLRDASEEEAKQQGRPIVYLPSSRTSKEDAAREIATRDHVEDGLIGVFKCVEPIWSYEVASDRERGILFLKRAPRKGLQYYHYWVDRDFGFMHGRISTWFPFQIQVCVNGREWLARKMDAAGLRYQCYENCFTDIEDVMRAQGMMDEMLRTAWPQWLDGLARRLNPAFSEMFRQFRAGY